MHTHLPLRWTGLGRLVLLAIAATVAVVLLLPATASSKQTVCFPQPRPDGPVTPKQGPPGTFVYFHGSKMGNVEEVAFKANHGWELTDWDYLGNGWVVAIVPDDAVTGPIVLNIECTPAQTQKFKVT